MGSAIADRLLAAGHEVAVWNRSAPATGPYAARAAAVLARPADAWAHGEIAVTMLADTAAVETVLAGDGGLLWAGGRVDGRIVIDMSTISVAGSAALAERAADAGAAFLRAPVTGNPSVVAAGTLGIIVSGPREAYDSVEALLRDIGPNLFYVGGEEQARVVKLAINLMLAGTTQLMAEAVVMAERNGVEPAAMLEVAGQSAIGSPFVRYKTPGIVAGDYSSTFTAKGLHKDLDLALECASDSDVPLPVTALVQQFLQGCIASGMGDQDFMALLPRLRREAGYPDPIAGQRVYTATQHRSASG
jgi:3-hydroxyisobutyrate dehydrogenase-like beta-hydroxyacid dehydrogenase